MTTQRHDATRPHGFALIGYLTRLPPRRTGPQAAGQVLYLPLSGTIVLPFQQVIGGWDTIVVADPAGGHRPGDTCRRAELEIETALTVPVADPLAALSPDEHAAVWLTRLWGHSPGGNLWAVARILAEELRPSGTRTVILDDPARRRLMVAARVVPPGLWQLIGHLTRHGYLSHTTDGTYRFTLPHQQARNRPNETDP
jgi:hypothetical protein